MRRKWGRIRGYLDELEEDMRLAGEQLAEIESLSAEQWEKSAWHRRLHTAAAGEIVRRALDVPFLGDLVRLAWKVGPEVSRDAPDFEGTPWAEAQRVHRYDEPSEGGAPPLEAPAAAIPSEPPARLRAAERALAHRTRSLAVALDDLVSPRNASAIVRTADALGLQEVHVIQPTGQHRIERTLTMRAERWVDLTWYRDADAFLEAMRRAERRILVADFGEDARPIDTVPLSDNVVLVVGSEQKGVSEAVREAADGHFYLPTVGFTSYLNVSVATAIACWTLDRRMREEGLRTPLDAEDRARVRAVWYDRLAKGNRGREALHRAFLDDPPKPADAVRAKNQHTPMGED